MKIQTPQEALDLLIKGNETYINANCNPADHFKEARAYTAQYGQSPYAVILTCSDSRVPPEHIFSAGIGDIFVVRTAGNVVGDFELGSIEYGIAHLGCKIVLVMGHSHCGAVDAALETNGRDEDLGYIESIVEEIQLGLAGATNAVEAENNNIAHSTQRVFESAVIRDLVEDGTIMVIPAKYDIESGKVDFLAG